MRSQKLKDVKASAEEELGPFKMRVGGVDVEEDSYGALQDAHAGRRSLIEAELGSFKMRVGHTSAEAHPG